MRGTIFFFFCNNHPDLTGLRIQLGYKPNIIEVSYLQSLKVLIFYGTTRRALILSYMLGKSKFLICPFGEPYLPLKLTIRPVPICADGRRYITADTAFWEEVKRSELLIIQEREAVV